MSDPTPNMIAGVAEDWLNEQVAHMQNGARFEAVKACLKLLEPDAEPSEAVERYEIAVGPTPGGHMGISVVNLKNPKLGAIVELVQTITDPTDPEKARVQIEQVGPYSLETARTLGIIPPEVDA